MARGHALPESTLDACRARGCHPLRQRRGPKWRASAPNQQAGARRAAPLRKHFSLVRQSAPRRLPCRSWTPRLRRQGGPHRRRLSMSLCVRETHRRPFTSASPRAAMRRTARPSPSDTMVYRAKRNPPHRPRRPSRPRAGATGGSPPSIRQTSSRTASSGARPSRTSRKSTPTFSSAISTR